MYRDILEHSPQSVQRPCHMNARIMWNMFSSKESAAAFWETPDAGLSKTHCSQLHAGQMLRQALQRMQRDSSPRQNANLSSGCHSLQLCDHIETTGLRIFLTVFAQHLIADNNLVALADFAAFQQAVLLADRNFTVHGFRLYGVTVSGDAQNAPAPVTHHPIQLAATGNADDVNVFPLDAVFCQQPG